MLPAISRKGLVSLSPVSPKITSDPCTCAPVPSLYALDSSDGSRDGEMLGMADSSDGNSDGEMLGIGDGSKEGTVDSEGTKLGLGVVGITEGTLDSDGTELGSMLLDGNDEADGDKVGEIDGYAVGVEVEGILDVVGSAVGNGRHGDACITRFRGHGVKVL